MSTIHQRRKLAEIAVPPTSELVGMFVKRNPKSPRTLAETAGRVAAALGGAAVKLTMERQRQLVAHKDQIPQLIEAILAQLDAGEREETVAGDMGSGINDLIGEGLTEALTSTEGSHRLETFATPTEIEKWAGPVAGPTILEKKFRIARSTLHDWQKSQAVIGLLKGMRKHVFPVEQFVDGRPVTGLAPIVIAAGSPRTAWLWLIEPHSSFGGRTPLNRLRAGKTAEVIDLANRDFGQS